MGMANILSVLAHYMAVGRQVILKSHFVDICEALLEPLPRAALPKLVYVDAATCRVLATTNSPATVMMSGIPNLFNMDEMVHGGLSDGGSRVVTSNVNISMALGDRWGAEKASQWYAAYALAGDADADFTLKGMPWMRVKSQSTKTISLGTILDASVAIDYVFSDNEFAGYMIYMLTGASKGLMRTITANDVSAGASRVTYTGDALTVAAGDWFLILPDTNFRWLTDIWNNSSSNITGIGNLYGPKGQQLLTSTGGWPCFVNKVRMKLFSGGGGGAVTAAGAAGGCKDKEVLTTPGTVYDFVCGAGGTTGNPTGNTGGSSTFAGESISGGQGGNDPGTSPRVPGWGGDYPTYDGAAAAFIYPGLCHPAEALAIGCGVDIARGGLPGQSGKNGALFIEWGY